MTITVYQRAIARKKAENGMEIEDIYLLPELADATKEEINLAVGLCNSIPYVPSLKVTKPRDEYQSKFNAERYPTLNIRINPTLKKRLNEFCRLSNTSQSILTRLAIEEYLEHHKKAINPAVQNLVYGAEE